MKSGIYSSASDRGPVSGTEKCSRLLTLLATFSAARTTEPAAARTPAAIWEQMSLPQLYAEEAMELRELKLLLMLDTPEETVERRLDMAPDTADCTPEKVELVVDFTPFQPVDTVDFTAFTAEDAVLRMVFQLELSTDWMLDQLLLVRLRRLFPPAVTELLTALTELVVALLMLFQLVFSTV